MTDRGNRADKGPAEADRIAIDATADTAAAVDERRPPFWSRRDVGQLRRAASPPSPVTAK
jgi:hypothetical protein